MYEIRAVQNPGYKWPDSDNTGSVWLIQAVSVPAAFGGVQLPDGPVIYDRPVATVWFQFTRGGLTGYSPPLPIFSLPYVLPRPAVAAPTVLTLRVLNGNGVETSITVGSIR